MKRTLFVTLVLVLAASAVVLVPGADAKKKGPPPITFSTCPFAANQANHTYKMTTGPGPCVGDAITVSANGITIDLGGFDLKGNGPSANAGVQINANVTGTHIKHGTITAFGRGIEAPTSSSGTVVDGITAVDNSAFGMLLGSATVKRSIAAANGGTGIDIVGAGTTSGKGVIQSTTATDNGSDGLSISQVASGLIDQSMSVSSGNRGVFMAAASGIVRRTQVVESAGIGVDMLGSTANTVDSVVASSNGGQGIEFETAAKAPVVTKSTVLGNGKLSFEEGILVNTATEKATVTSNIVSGSFGDGIKVVATSAKVDGNKANGNGWGVKDGGNFGINSPTGNGKNKAAGNDAIENQCVDDVLC